MSEIAETIESFHTDRWLAHKTLFAHRHPVKSSIAHRELVESIYRPIPRLGIEGFRGFAKSTTLEEAAVLKAAFREFRNMVVVGSSYARAVDRLASIKRELEMNEILTGMFGGLKGPVWQEGKIVLSHGACIQALGRDQSMLGIKHLDWRPDAALVDDVEDPDEVRTDAERAQTWDWFIKTFLPSLDHPLFSWVRVLGTRRGTGSLPERLEKDGWPTVKFPIEYLDEEGRRRATWPAKFPLPIIDKMKQTYRGDMHTYMQEYMCQASSESDRVFRREDLRCDPRPRSWQAVMAMYDPARTTSRQSATTGKAVWSWVNNRLIFWEVKAEAWLPDQIVGDIFATQEEYDCTWIGFEQDGLNEWALQPIRQEMLKRRAMLPLLPVKAPRGKLQFIGGLQPYMRAGEVIFAGPSEEFHDAIDQFLSFPQGKIDAPNACAYALLLRPGAPVYDAFSEDNIAEILEPMAGAPLYLAGNSDGSVVTAALVQRSEGEIRILADWVREGTPAEVVVDIHQEAMLRYETNRWGEREFPGGEKGGVLTLPERRMVLTRLPINWIVPQWHLETWRNVGLMQAVRRIPQTVSAAPVGPEQGRIVLSRMLETRRHGRLCLSVSSNARWTLRGLAGGYARELDKRGIAAAQPDSGIYKLLMEGIESFAAVGVPATDAEEDRQPVAYDRRGVAYKSALPERR